MLADSQSDQFDCPGKASRYLKLQIKAAQKKMNSLIKAQTLRLIGILKDCLFYIELIGFLNFCLKLLYLGSHVCH